VRALSRTSGSIETVRLKARTYDQSQFYHYPIAQLGLPFRRRGRAFLADGSESIFDIYEGTVVWNGQMQRTPIDEADSAPLIGMQMLAGYELNIEVVTDGQVTVKLLP